MVRADDRNFVRHSRETSIKRVEGSIHDGKQRARFRSESVYSLRGREGRRAEGSAYRSQRDHPLSLSCQIHLLVVSFEAGNVTVFALDPGLRYEYQRSVIAISFRRRSVANGGLSRGKPRLRYESPFRGPRISNRVHDRVRSDFRSAIERLVRCTLRATIAVESKLRCSASAYLSAAYLPVVSRYPRSESIHGTETRSDSPSLAPSNERLPTLRDSSRRTTVLSIPIDSYPRQLFQMEYVISFRYRLHDPSLAPLRVE